MAVLELCLLPWLVLQAPAPQAPFAPADSATPSPTAPAGDPADWLPSRCIAAVTLRVDGETDLDEVFDRISNADPTGNTERMTEEWLRTLEVSGLDLEEAQAIARNGVAIGLVGWDEGMARFVLVVDLQGTTQTVRDTLRDAGRSTPGGLVTSWSGDRMILASTEEIAEATRAQLDDPSSTGLGSAPGYATATAETPLDSPVALTVFLRPDALYRAALGAIPPQKRAIAEKIAAALGLLSVDRAMLRLALDGETIETAACCALPGDESPLARLFTGGPLVPELAGCVPPTATSYAFSSADLGGFVRETLATVTEVEPGLGMMVEAMTSQIEGEGELDFDRDLLGALSGTTVSVVLPEGRGMLLGLTDGRAFASTLEQWLRSTGSGIEQERNDSGTSYRVPMGDGGEAAFGVRGNWLCFGETTETWNALEAQLASPTPHAGARALLEQIEPGTLSVFASADGHAQGASTTRDGTARFSARFRITGFPGPGTASVGPAPAELIAALKRAEERPGAVSADDLVKLARSTHVGVAARAAWLLGRRDEPEALGPLADLVSTSPHPEVRLQAVHALLRRAGPASFAAAVAGLDDNDPRVRTLAAQLLGRLRRSDAASPLVAALSAQATEAVAGTPHTDLQAMLVALGDLGDAAWLLPAAEAMNGCPARDVGEALTWCFQKLSPTLPEADEATLLVAVLDHSETSLRRYAIGRLAELRDPSTCKALEGRLATEGPELRPLLEVALEQVRRDRPTSIPATVPDAALAGTWQKVRARWQGMTEQQRMILIGLTGLAGLGVIILSVLLARRRRAYRRARTLELVHASEDEAWEEDEQAYDDDASYEEVGDEGYEEEDDDSNDDEDDEEWSEATESEEWAAVGADGDPEEPEDDLRG